MWMLVNITEAKSHSEAASTSAERRAPRGFSSSMKNGDCNGADELVTTATHDEARWVDDVASPGSVGETCLRQ